MLKEKGEKRGKKQREINMFEVSKVRIVVIDNCSGCAGHVCRTAVIDSCIDRNSSANYHVFPPNTLQVSTCSTDSTTTGT